MYTIKDAVELTNLSEHTIRYYDREGLIPFLHRSSGGVRQFSEDDIKWLRLICCLKDSGMPIQQIKEFMALCLKGEKTCEERRALLLKHRDSILNQIERLHRCLAIVDYKVGHYKQIGLFHIDRDTTLKGSPGPCMIDNDAQTLEVCTSCPQYRRTK